MAILMLFPYLILPLLVKVACTYITTESNMKTLLLYIYHNYIPVKYSNDR